MATIVNTPSGSHEDSGMGLIVGVIVAILVVLLFFVYGLPALRGTPAANDNGTSASINVDLPSGGAGSGNTGGTGSNQ